MMDRQTILDHALKSGRITQEGYDRAKARKQRRQEVGGKSKSELGRLTKAELVDLIVELTQ